MKTRHRILTVLLTVLITVLLPVSLIFSAVGAEPPFTGAALTYYNDLKEKGFPADYAEPLTRLHLLYPAWEFEPLIVNRSWKDTVSLETKDAKTNLIHQSETYKAYRHRSNSTIYDSGFYQASTAAVSYFLDPRNFLTEADIFQFYDQQTAGSRSQESLEAVLSGTFMENTVLDGGQTYAEYLLQVGEEVGIDPVFLAVRLRQEQGDGTSPLLHGKCGTLLNRYYQNQTATTENGKPIKPPAPDSLSEDLTELDGYYNLFNIGASGDGVFAIYRNALTYAKAHGWNTREAAIRGGAEFLKNDYIRRGQSTVYLQKFDVCTSGSLHQYMQNVGGALSEGRTLYRFFAGNSLTDIGCVFRIPVFSGMPASVSADPAGGTCTLYATSASRYRYTLSLSSPVVGSADRDALYGNVQIPHNEMLTVTGTLTHDYGAAAFEYAWDNGTWHPLQGSSLSLTLSPEELPEWGDHFLTIRAVHTYDKNRLAVHTLCAAFQVTVVPPPSVTLTLRSGNAEQIKLRYEGDVYTFPVCEDPEFAGYAGSDGTLYPSGYALTLTHSVTYTAVFLPLSVSAGAALYIGDTNASVTHLRFAGTAPASALATLPTDAVTLGATLTRNSKGGTCAVTQSKSSGDIVRLYAQTPALSGSDLNDDFSVRFSVCLHYSDGTERTLTSPESQRRTATAVSAAALADQSVSYPEEVRRFLQKLLV